MHFLITARYGTGTEAAARRQAAEAEHRQGIVQLASEGAVLNGGLKLDDQGRPNGSLLMVQFPDRGTLDFYLAQEPYVRDRVWEDLTVLAFHRPDTQSLQAGQPAPGPVSPN